MTRTIQPEVCSGCFIKFFEQNADTVHSGKAVSTNQRQLILSLSLNSAAVGREEEKEIGQKAKCKPCLGLITSIITVFEKLSPASDSTQAKSAA